MRIVILSGGNGTRLWPASRHHKPKQFLKLFGDESLLVQTARRALACGARHLAVVTNAEQLALTEAELDGAGLNAEIIVEPAQRNTGPAMALAAARAALSDGGEPLVFLPADHYIADEARFTAAIALAAREAAGGSHLVVIGRPPDRPETGYGYIEHGAEVTRGVYEVARFVEKPDKESAIRLLADGRYWWNTGILAGTARLILEELQRHAPQVAAAVTDAVGAPNRYVEAPALSFDYAVLEKSERVRVVSAGFGWSDVGSWSGWAEHAAADPSENAANGATRLLAYSSHGNAVWSDKTVVLNGVDDLLVVETSDVLYVTRRVYGGATGDVRQRAVAVLPELK